jgi:hypothetical protein
LAAQVPEIQSFIESELERQEKVSVARDERESAGPLLNALFRDLLEEAWA